MNWLSPNSILNLGERKERWEKAEPTRNRIGAFFMLGEIRAFILSENGGERIWRAESKA